MYDESGDEDFVYRRYEISRPILRKWANRYKQDGIVDLVSQNIHTVGGVSMY
ncbi:hypothetical protein [Vibrio algarum]|uniref:hypothetical protein n=1 Tax=Vibrio algarum TaxID=3020714 RepID=UPI00389A5A5B